MYRDIFAKVQMQPISMRDVAYDVLRRAIITNKLAPLERLLEEHLARELNVSRTPLREALKVLESEGFAQRLPSGGYQVAPLSAQELDNLYSIRLVLEGLAARKAAEHVTPEALDAMEHCNEQMKLHWQKQRIEESLQAGRAFHAEIYRASHNNNLALLLQRLGDQIARYRYYSIIYRVPEAYEDHFGITAALRDRDAERAEALSRAHVAVEHRLVLSKLRERMAAGAPG
jgi:DNA-binding GntR family transcriptional regulator